MQYETHCASDALEIFNISGVTDFLKICGSTLPAPIFSSQNSMYIRFSTDNLTEKNGFKMQMEICGKLLIR